MAERVIDTEALEEYRTLVREQLDHLESLIPRMENGQRLGLLPAFGQLDALWPCVHVRAAKATSASRLVVVRQSPTAGTRVRAYGVKVGSGGWRPTIVNVEVEAR